MAMAPPLVPGVDEQGALPLPWIAAPLAQAAALTRSHALLAHGPAGAGQLEFALVLAQGWLCETAPDQRQGLQPCGHCASCHLVRQRSHPDLLILVPDALRHALGWLGEDEGGKSDAKPSKEIRIDAMRQAIDRAHRTAGRSRGKALVVHPADAMNRVTANALLKTLEEPPGDLRIVLTTADPERLLPTVRSRCQRLTLPLPDAATAQAWLAARKVAEPAALLAFAAGSPLEAAALAAEGLDAAVLAQLPRRIATGDAAVLAGLPVPRALDLLGKLMHDVMVVQAGGRPRYFPAGSVPAGADADALQAWHASLRRAQRHDEHPWNAALLIEALITEAVKVWPPRPRLARGASLNSAR